MGGGHGESKNGVKTATRHLALLYLRGRRLACMGNDGMGNFATFRKSDWVGAQCTAHKEHFYGLPASPRPFRPPEGIEGVKYPFTQVALTPENSFLLPSSSLLIRSPKFRTERTAVGAAARAN